MGAVKSPVTGYDASPFARPGRFFVPDLSPEGRPQLRDFTPRYAFVAESPHVSEISPEKLDERRPLCGKAGLQWWGLLSELLEGESSTDVSRSRLEAFCQKHRIAVLNAVQYPLDPKVSASFAQAAPALTIGFSKAPGTDHYKKMKGSRELGFALQSLRERLQHPSLGDCPIYCLGNDSEWFVSQALGKEEFLRRVKGRIPHPSAWWRRGGLFGRIAREKLGLLDWGGDAVHTKKEAAT